MSTLGTLETIPMEKIMATRFLRLVLAASMILTAGCRPEAGKEKQKPEGMVEIRLELPGMYNPAPGPSTATSKTESKAYYDSRTYQDSVPRPLPEGSTLWLIYELQTYNSPWGDQYDQYGEAQYKSYVVLNSAEGMRSLYPCAVDENGVPDMGSVEPSLFLEPGTYRFRAVSPARAWNDETALGLQVDNGEQLLASDFRYTQTQPLVDEINLAGSGIQVITLNPLVNQTARIQFTLRPDVSIHQLDMMPAGIELSGLQDIVNEAEGNYNWSSVGLDGMGDTIRAYAGNKRSRTVLHDYVRAEEDSVMIVNNQRLTLPQGSLITSTGILPTDASSNSLIVMFNLQVNGIPTQYSMHVNRKVFRAGRSYHYVGDVSIENGITVFSWQSISWTEDVEI